METIKKEFRPYLVQRLSLHYTRRNKPIEINSKSFSDYLRCDYMGAAEFEWGAIPGTLKLWYDTKENLETTVLDHQLGKFYIVTPESTTNEFSSDICNWWRGECDYKSTPRLKEPTCVVKYERPNTYKLNPNYDGWLSVDFGDRQHCHYDNTPWLFAIFKTEELAKVFKHCMRLY